MYINETTQNTVQTTQHSTNNTKHSTNNTTQYKQHNTVQTTQNTVQTTQHSTYKYTYYQNTQPHGDEDKNTGNNSPPRQGTIQEPKLLLHSYYTTHL